MVRTEVIDPTPITRIIAIMITQGKRSFNVSFFINLRIFLQQKLIFLGRRNRQSKKFFHRGCPLSWFKLEGIDQ
jgi:hypothetical protein